MNKQYKTVWIQTQTGWKVVHTVFIISADEEFGEGGSWYKLQGPGSLEGGMRPDNAMYVLIQ
jgi:hypothetical protein